MKKNQMIAQDIDQPVFGKRSKMPRWSKRLILGLAVIISLVIIFSFNLKKSADLSRLELKEPEELTPVAVPTEASSPSGKLREKWRKINEKLEKVDPQQKLFQPPKLNFN